MAQLDALGATALMQIASAGAGFTLSSALGLSDLMQIASRLKPGAVMVVQNSAALGAQSLMQIAACAPGRVYFE